METNGGSVGCAGGSLGPHRHICAFFNGIDDEHRVLGSFIKEGFDRGDKAFHIVDPEVQGEHLKRLVEAGIDAEQAIGTGQLELRRWQDAYLRGDRFDQDAMLALLEEVLRSGAASGYLVFLEQKERLGTLTAERHWIPGMPALAAGAGQVHKEDLVRDLPDNLIAVAAAAARAEGLAEARHVRWDSEGLADVVGLKERAIVWEHEPVRPRDVGDVPVSLSRRKRIAVDRDGWLAAEALVVDED